MDFYRNWADYVAGFGQLKGEHWLGLENLVCITTRLTDIQFNIETSCTDCEVYIV